MGNDASINRTGPLAVVRTWPGASVPVAAAAGGAVHGAIRTITGSGFGTRTTTPMTRVWIHGNDVRIDGVADTSEQPGGDITASTVWRSTSSDAPIVLDASRTRHSRVSHTYFQKSFATLNDPGDLYARGLCPASHDKLYLTYWVRNLQHYFSSWIVSHSGVTGAFQTNADYSRGETCTVTLNDATTRTAYVTHVTANFVTLDFNGTSVSSTLLNGATVAGDTSGATCTLVATSAGVDYALPGAVKEMRAWQPSSAGQPREIITTAWSNNGTIDIDYYDSAGALVGGTGGAGTDLNGLGHHGVGQWERYELEIDFSGPTGVIRRRINGGTVGELAGLDKQYLNPNYGWAVTLLGLDTPGTSSVPRSELGFSQDLGEIYIDNELVRVFIGDAPTYAACTQLEHQYIRSQTDTQIEIEINQGGFTDLTGKYFHVVGPGFTPILEGVPV